VTSIAVWTWTRSIALEVFVIHALRINAKGLKPTGTSLLLLMVISEKRLLGFHQPIPKRLATFDD